MSFESEVLLARLRPRASKLILPTVFLMLASFIASLLTDRFDLPWQNYVLYGSCAALAIFGFLFPIIRYLTTWTDITNSRVVARSGLFGQNFRETSLADVTAVETKPAGTVVLRLFDDSIFELVGLPKPKLVAQEIGRLVERRRGNS
ncbi:MAG: hypothetical protein RL556_558 [Actinomycetota bacterium]